MKAAPAASARGAFVVECKESRIGKLPVPVPKGVTVTIDNNKVTAKVSGRREHCTKQWPGAHASARGSSGPEG